MSFTHDRDPGNVKALLEQLRTSQAFAEVTNAAQPQSSLLPPAQPEPASTSRYGVASQVSSLLAKLHPNGYPGSGAPQNTSTDDDFSAPPPHPPSPLQPHSRNLRSLTFIQAITHISNLAGNPDFLAAVEKLKRDQANLERKLWDERSEIIRAHEEKVKIARTRASMIGSPGKQEETILNRTLAKELETFHKSTVLPAWDALVTKQQCALEVLNVPTMFATSLDTDRTRQQRVVQLLDELENEP